MKYVADYYRVSGTSLKEGCCFLANRSDAERGYKPREGESMLVTVQPETAKPNDFLCRVPLLTDGWITDVWLSESKTVYLARADRHVVRASNALSMDLKADSFESTELPASLFGIWGLSDRCVFAWGDGQDSKGSVSHPVFQFDGETWKELPPPGFEVLSMHGIAPDHAFAVGHDSGIALWDGAKWTRMAAPGPETYTCVHVVSRDEAYAVGVNNFVVEGSRHGWAKIAQGDAHPVPLSAVAKWMDQLWIGAGPAGLLRRVGRTDKLEVVKPNIQATGFDVRKDLLIITPQVLVSTSDGKSFTGVARDAVLKSRGQHKLNDFVK